MPEPVLKAVVVAAREAETELHLAEKAFELEHLNLAASGQFPVLAHASVKIVGPVIFTT